MALTEVTVSTVSHFNFSLCLVLSSLAPSQILILRALPVNLLYTNPGELYLQQWGKFLNLSC